VKEKGILYLIPTGLDPEYTGATHYSQIVDIVNNTRHFVVEKGKSARRFIRSCNPAFDLQKAHFAEYAFKKSGGDPTIYLLPLLDGHDVGLLSEAGSPCIADPGAELVARAHELNIRVIPLAGPSAIFLALMASGMNGQKFTFHGYLPRYRNQLRKELKKLEKLVSSTGSTQIFMETPYRNTQVLQEALDCLHPQTRFCIACDLTMDTETIISRRVGEWKEVKIDQFSRRPSIFLLGISAEPFK
jgi:16S rRNA (cytidine1402-2'-O)-methyltransferase